MKLISNKKAKGFLKLYFFIILLNLIAWVASLSVAYFFDWSLLGVGIIYLVNLIVFLIFLYAVIRATKSV